MVLLDSRAIYTTTCLAGLVYKPPPLPQPQNLTPLLLGLIAILALVIYGMVRLRVKRPLRNFPVPVPCESCLVITVDKESMIFSRALIQHYKRKGRHARMSPAVSNLGCV